LRVKQLCDLGNVGFGFGFGMDVLGVAAIALLFGQTGALSVMNVPQLRLY
jgi:hypothetical protein